MGVSGCRGRAISAPSAASWRISANQLHALECGGCASPSTQTQRENTYRADVDNGVQELGQGLGQITVHIICKHNIHSPWRKQSKQKTRAHTHRQTQTNTSELPHNNALEQDATCKSQHSHVGVERKRHSKAIVDGRAWRNKRSRDKANKGHAHKSLKLPVLQATDIWFRKHRQTQTQTHVQKNKNKNKREPKPHQQEEEEEKKKKKKKKKKEGQKQRRADAHAGQMHTPTRNILGRASGAGCVETCISKKGPNRQKRRETRTQAPKHNASIALTSIGQAQGNTEGKKAHTNQKSGLQEEHRRQRGGTGQAESVGEPQQSLQMFISTKRKCVNQNQAANSTKVKREGEREVKREGGREPQTHRHRHRHRHTQT